MNSYGLEGSSKLYKSLSKWFDLSKIVVVDDI